MQQPQTHSSSTQNDSCLGPNGGWCTRLCGPNGGWY
jgi:hypothetical protein